jgi:ParB-like nuclease domain
MLVAPENPNKLLPKLGLPRQTPSGDNPTPENAPPSNSVVVGQGSPRIQKIALDLVTLSVPRWLNPGVVDELAESFGTVGQLQPISVRPSGDSPDKFEVIFGVHRTAAAKLLNWPAIDALIFKGDELDLSLIEIAENLHRKELSVYEKACLQTKWLKLAQQKGVQTAQPGGVQPHDKGYSKAARMLGRGTTREEIRRSEKIASIADEVIPYLIEHGLENHKGALLDIAKGPTASDQINIAREYTSRTHKPEAASSVEPPVTSNVTVPPIKIAPRTPTTPSTDHFPTLPAFLDRRDADLMLNSLVEEWASCRLRVLLLNASEDVRSRFLHETLLSEFSRTDATDSCDGRPNSADGVSR